MSRCLQVQRGAADGVISDGPNGFVRIGCETIHELSVPVVGSVPGGRPRRNPVREGGRGARGVRGARRPCGRGTAAERPNERATGDGGRVPPARRTGTIAVSWRRQPVPGAGRATLRGRTSVSEACGHRTACVPVHGCLEQYARVCRVPVERGRGCRPNRVADEGDATSWSVPDGDGDVREGRAAQVQRDKPRVH